MTNTHGTRVRLDVTCDGCNTLIATFYDKIEEKYPFSCPECDDLRMVKFPWRLTATIEVSDAEAKRFKRLEEDSETLSKPQLAGVDNWDGYEIALSGEYDDL